MLTNELEQLRAAFADTTTILQTFKAENERLLAKASLEDEVLTLATSLQSARDEIRFVLFSSFYEPQVEVLEII